MISFVKPVIPLGKNIHCRTFTKGFFEKIAFEPNKENLINNFSNHKKVPIQYMDQIHGKNVQYVKSPTFKSLSKTDALITNIDNCALAAMTADCLPIALSLEDGSKFGIIHAGWKGLLSNLIETFIERIESDDSKIKAWIGPSISAKNYEVGREVYELFIEKDTSSQSSFTEINKDKWLFDLQMEAIRILDLRNISSENSDICTYDSENMYSYRKNRTNERLVTIIWRTQ